jgi:uncharacterized protein
MLSINPDAGQSRGSEMMHRAVMLFLLLAVPAAAQSTENPAERLVAAAYGQIGVTRLYDPSYRRIAFPGGDVPLERGVCSDVIVRAYRGIGIDLQRLVHEDMRQHFADYPHLWKLAAPDANIDHRRVANLAAFFARRGGKLPVSAAAEDYRPGDIVTWRLPAGLAHIGISAPISPHARA